MNFVHLPLWYPFSQTLQLALITADNGLMMSNWFPGAVLAASGLLAFLVAVLCSGASVRCLALIFTGLIVGVIAIVGSRLLRHRSHGSENRLRERQGDILHVHTR
jgi:ammonia channel protein AmtB